MFAALGLLLACYTGYAALAGEVVVTKGPGARRVRREQSPGYFWSCIAIYAGLALVLVTVF